MTVVAALKLVPGRPAIDPVHGGVTIDRRLAGCSPADEAALEWALRLGETWDEPVAAVTAGPEAADLVLRTALAVGIGQVRRAPISESASSASAAAALAQLVAELHGSLVLCGAFSLDRGSGAVPALLAHHLGARQALGAVHLEPVATGELQVLRRIDGGRRERLAVAAPAVVSVEGATARLRRASLGGELAAERATVEVQEVTTHAVMPAPPAGTPRPYRPATRVVPPPQGVTALDRVRQLTDLASPRTPPRTLALPPAEAADAILAQLAEWDETAGEAAPG